MLAVMRQAANAARASRPRPAAAMLDHGAVGPVGPVDGLVGIGILQRDEARQRLRGLLLQRVDLLQDHRGRLLVVERGRQVHRFLEVGIQLLVRLGQLREDLALVVVQAQGLQPGAGGQVGGDLLLRLGLVLLHAFGGGLQAHAAHGHRPVEQQLLHLNGQALALVSLLQGVQHGGAAGAGADQGARQHGAGSHQDQAERQAQADADLHVTQVQEVSPSELAPSARTGVGKAQRPQPL